jgi:hypothetical protein
LLLLPRLGGLRMQSRRTFFNILFAPADCIQTTPAGRSAA